jgi:hypothetical protein
MKMISVKLSESAKWGGKNFLSRLRPKLACKTSPKLRQNLAKFCVNMGTK